MLGSAQAQQRAAALDPAPACPRPRQSAIHRLIIFGKLGFLPKIPQNGPFPFTRLLQNGLIYV